MTTDHAVELLERCIAEAKARQLSAAHAAEAGVPPTEEPVQLTQGDAETIAALLRQRY